MPPRPRETDSLSSFATGPLGESDDIKTDKISQDVFEPDNRKLEIVWKNVIGLGAVHLMGLYGLYLMFTSTKLLTAIYAQTFAYIGGFSITGGAHRLWAHRSYKAKWPLKLLLVVLQTLGHQNSIIEWVRDHRVHHKFQETDADPHNVKRGFFFAHMGWLMCKKHEEVKEKGKGIDMSDLYAEPLLRFQHKYFYILMPIGTFVIPTLVPMVLWGETFSNSFFPNMWRYIFYLNSTWLVNSVAHLWGNKPYDRFISATESLFVSFFAIGEGWHNYHHTFPWDYKASEFGRMNLTLIFINFFAKIGWAYDLKTVSKELIKTRVERTGDGTHEIWGWGDKDQSPEDYKFATIYNKEK